MIPSVHFLIRQAARERLAATRTLNEESKARHEAMADLYLHRAKQLQAAQEHSTVQNCIDPEISEHDR